jgi:TRAP-type mannitol/chloroaromatic compound transport system permease large subunit
MIGELPLQIQLRYGYNFGIASGTYTSSATSSLPEWRKRRQQQQT